jgi:apolipoprotein N-acyltransferase
VLFEWMRSLGVYAFPWFLLASSHARESALPILQIASLTAQWGLSFAICIITGFLGEAWRSKNKRYLSVLLIPVCLWIFGRYAMTAISQTAKPGVSLSVAVIQANDKGANNSFALYEGLTRRAVAEQKPQLVVWPEGSVRGDALGQASVGALARELNTAILIGCYDEETQSKRPRNRALLFDASGQVTGTYQKQRLAPFGEVYPFRSSIPDVYKAFGVTYDSYLAGEVPGVLTLPHFGTLGTVICFESAFPWVARGSVSLGAQAIFVLTSDQTFDGTIEQQQHLDVAIVRAVENRRFIVQAAGTGISAVIDPFGRVMAALPSDAREILPSRITLNSTPGTPPTDGMVSICWAIALGSMLYCLRRNAT